MTTQERKRKIKALLAENGKTLAGVARSVGRRREYLHLIINGSRTGYKYRPVIAAACGVTVDFLWPDTPPQYREAA